MNQAPSGNRWIDSAATCSSRRVLPRPPIPSKVSRRPLHSSALTSSSSASRPMNDVDWCGRLLGMSLTGIHHSAARTTRNTFSVSSGATQRAAGGATSKISIGSATPFTIQWPCDSTLSSVLPSSSRASVVISVCPPRASDITRAAVGFASPSTSSGLAPRATSAALFSRRSTGPTWIPARARTGVSMAASAGWYAIVKATASTARSNSISMPSVLSISRPWCRCSRSRAIRSCAAHTCAIAVSPIDSASLVLSTTSVRSSARISLIGRKLRAAVASSAARRVIPHVAARAIGGVAAPVRRSVERGPKLRSVNAGCAAGVRDSPKEG